MPVLKRFRKDFFDAWTPAMAYVLGFMFADGAVWRGRRGNWFFAFYSNDLEIIQSIKASLASDHKVGIKERSPEKYPNQKTGYILQIGSRAVCEKLVAFGVTPNKSLTMVFPAVPAGFIGDFTRGYFDGDGSVNFGRYWRKDRDQWKYQLTINFTSGSKPFLEGLFRALHAYTSGGRIGIKKGGYELVFSRHDSVAIYRLMYNNVPAGLFLKRKFEVFQKAFQQLHMRP